MIKSKEVNVREMLLASGIQPFLADIAIPYMWFLPGTVDPDSASIIELNRGIQRNLHRLGYRRVQVNGVIDRPTVAALNQVSPNWMEKAFVQIYGDLFAAMKDPERAAHQMMFRMGGMGSYFEYEGWPPGPLPGRLLRTTMPLYRTPPGPLGLGTVHWDNQVRLEFGEGVNTKTNMVPMPKLSGLTYQTFKDLQRQINRLLTKVPGGGRVAEDGILGTQTLAALKSIEKSRGRIWGVDASDTFRMAKYAATIATTLKDDANSLAISPSANMGRTTTTTSQNEKTKGKTPSGDSTWIYLLLAGGVAWYAAQKKGKKKK